MDNGASIVGTLTGSGATLPGARAFTCHGGVVVGAGTFDVPSYSGFPHGITAPMAISLVRGAASVVLVESGNSRIAGTGTFLQAPAGTASCLLPGGSLPSTTWTGAFTFGATTLL